MFNLKRPWTLNNPQHRNKFPNVFHNNAILGTQTVAEPSQRNVLGEMLSNSSDQRLDLPAASDDKFCPTCIQRKAPSEFLIEFGKKNLVGTLGKSCQECRESKNSKRRKVSIKCEKMTLEAFLNEVAKDALSERREGFLRHNNVYYHLTNVRDLIEPQSQEIQESQDETVNQIAEFIVAQLEDRLGYIFRNKYLNSASRKESDEPVDELVLDDQENENRNLNPQNSAPSTYVKRFYRCSQDSSMASYSKYDKSTAVPRRQRRRKMAEPRYNCSGSLSFWIPKDLLIGATIPIPSGKIQLEDDEILLYLNHQCDHPPRARKPVPQSVRDFIKSPDNACRSPCEMYRRIYDAVKAKKLDGVDMVSLTDCNVRYWLFQSQKNDYMRHLDPWESAVAYLREQPGVTVHSYIHERRKFVCWYFAKLFDVNLVNVSEVYIDSTHSTNGQNAELFAIIACEAGYGVPVAYMLMEKKSTEEGKEFPQEVMAACVRFFSHAKELGLEPVLAHTDKSAAEIGAIKSEAGWPNTTISLCSWHVDKDVNERLSSHDAENVHNRTSHGWSQFDNNHLELGFIETNWLERYRERRKEIVRRRLEDFQSRGETPDKKQLGKNEETVLNKRCINPIRALMRKHIHYHPFKFPRTMPKPENGESETPRSIWLRQAKEMHALCKKYKEGYAWEYLWNNWYRFDKWQLWARAVNLDYYPIIQTNAPVEVHWNYLKNRILYFLPHPRVDRLCFEIHHTAMPILIIKIQQFRAGIKDSSWHRNMVHEWKELDEKIDDEDAKDLEEAEQKAMDPDAESSPSWERKKRMKDDHRTDVEMWDCKCAAFNHSPYHICSHLIRLYGRPYPVKKESVRQHRPPLLFIETFHDPSQKHVYVPSTHHSEVHPPASIEELGITGEELLDLSMQSGEAGDNEDEDEDYSRIEEIKSGYQRFFSQIQRAVKYAENELEQGGERARRLPKSDLKGFKKLIKLANNAHIIDKGRRRRTTWGPEREGGNMYRD